MSSVFTSRKVVLLGTGKMGLAYAQVLKGLDNPPVCVIGRSKEGSDRFKAETGIPALINGDGVDLKGAEFAIVAVSIESLFSVTARLIEAGVKNILLEKPAGINVYEVVALSKKAEQFGAQIWVAYNRRFYASVIRAEEIITEDGGVESFQFDFTEWSDKIRQQPITNGVKENWFLANSSHVVDMAFYLGGHPLEMTCYQGGSLDWHSSASVFSGAGKSEQGALFSYHANWDAPGRWSVEILTRQRRLIFRPLEQLQCQHRGSVAIDPIVIDDTLDKDYKPGLFLQTKAFLAGDCSRLKSLDDQIQDLKTYYKIAGYKYGE